MQSLRLRFRLSWATVLLLLGHINSAVAGWWWQNPTLQCAEDFGSYVGTPSPNYWNKDESDQYLWCPLGTVSGSYGLLYSIPALRAATSATGVAEIAVGRPSDFYGDNWKGGAISDDLGRVLTGDGNTSSGTPLNTDRTSLPVSGGWSKDTNAFRCAQSDTSFECDGMDFSHDSLYLYSNTYNINRSRLYKWTVGNLGTNGVGLTVNTYYTTSLNRLRNVSVCYIGGKDLVYYGEGNAPIAGGSGGKVCVYDTVLETESVLIPAEGVGTTSDDITNVKVGGVGLGQMHLYVQRNDGRLAIYDLNADGKSVASTTPVKSFSVAQMKTLLGIDSLGNMRCFVVCNDEQYAFTSSDATTASCKLYVLSGLPEIGVQQPAGTDLTDGVSTNAFGNAAVGLSTSPKIYTITNSGPGTLFGLAVTKNGTDQSMFTVGALGATNLAPGLSTTFSVTFTPSSVGIKTAAIHIASNDSDENPFDIGLTGNGKLGTDGTVLLLW